MHDLIITNFHSHYYVAITENQKLKYFYLEDQNHHSLVGHIYYGTVMRVMPGMQSAFIDIGEERTAFLHIKDCYGADPEAKIAQILSAGQNIIVQVLKDPIGTKGARLSTEITLPSTYLVYQPYGRRNGVSQKIYSSEERTRLTQWMATTQSMGLIVRTVAEGIKEEELQKDYQYLHKLWDDLHASVIHSQQRRCLWKDDALPLRILRDFSKLGFSKIYVNSAQDAHDIKEFMTKYFPEQSYECLHQAGKITAFSQFKIASQFFSAMETHVPLKSGGSVVIEQTESMVTVDVNTSGFVGQKNARETILKTNLEAVDVLAHQIPLRELGGLIIIDFIDMAEAEDQEKIHLKLLEQFKKDLMPTHILPISSVGITQMTRKRITESSPQKYFQPCPCCHLRSTLLSPYVVLIKFLELLETIPFKEDKTLVISARQDVLTMIQAQEEKWKTYSQLSSMPWSYEPIAGYHNQLTLGVYPSLIADPADTIERSL